MRRLGMAIRGLILSLAHGNALPPATWLSLIFCLAACQGTGRAQGSDWLSQGPWIIEDASGAQRLESARPTDGQATSDSFVVDLLSDLVYGPDWEDTSRSRSRVRVAPAPVANSRRIGFRVSVRW